MQETNNKKMYDFSDAEVLRVTKFFNHTENPTQAQTEEARRALYVAAIYNVKREESAWLSHEHAKHIAERTYDGLTAEFRINIEEYVNGKPLSPVTYRNETLAKLMDMNKRTNQDASFTYAAKIMAEFIALGDRATDDFCHNYWMRRYN